MATRNLSRQHVWSRFLVLAIWGFFFQPLAVSLPLVAQSLDLGTVTTILDGANLEQYFSQEDIAASNANSLAPIPMFLLEAMQASASRYT